MGPGHSNVKRGVLTFAFIGALGFGAGGAIAGSLGLFNPENPIFPLFFAILGATGGASLGVALRSWKRVGLLALAGCLGFLIGSWPLLLGSTAMTIGELPMHPNQAIFAAFALFIGGGIQGATGTVALRLVLRSGARVGWLIAVGAAGFGIGAETALCILIGFPGSLILAIWGLVGGASLGAAIGYQRSTK